MFLRRLRTVMDQLLQPPATADSLKFESRVDEIFAQAAPLLGATAVTAMQRLKEYFPAHRENLYLIHSIDRATDPTQIKVLIPEFVTGAQFFVPTENSLGTSWTGLTDPANIDQWGTGPMGIGYERAPKTSAI